jgi:type IV secretion system protein TrbE
MSYTATKKLVDKMQNRIGFADLLGYAVLVKNKIIVMKDGSFQACFRFYGEDIQSVIEEMSVAHSMRWSHAVSKIWTENILIENDVIRRKVQNYSDPIKFPDLVTSLIDHERRYQFENAGQMYESVSYVTITYREKKELSSKAKKFIYNTEDQAREKTSVERIQEFESKLRQFVQFVSYGHGDKFDRLKGDELMSYLFECKNGEKRKVLAPKENGFLDMYVARENFLSGHQVKVGDIHVKVLTIDEYPAKAHAMMMHSLNTLPIEFRYHTRYALLSKTQANSILTTVQKSWSSKAIGIKGIVIEAFGGQVKLNESAQAKNLETGDALSENDDGEIKYGLYNSTFVFFDKDESELNRKVADFSDHVQNLGFVLREEQLNATEAYLGSLPGHGGYNVRLNPMDSISWAYLLPISAIYCGESHCPNPLYPENSPPLLYAVTGDSNAYRLNTHVKDVGHTLTIGPTGSGKSTLEQLIAAQQRKYQKSRVICLDKDKSNKYFILSIGGKYYDPTDLETSKIAVLSNIDDVYGFEMTYRWLCDTFSMNGVSMNSERRQHVRESLKRIVKLDKNSRKFTNLEFQEKELRMAFNNLRTSIFGDLMDGTDDQMFENDVFGIDMGAILNLEKQIAAPIVKAIIDKLTYLFQERIPTILQLEEVWMLLEEEEFKKEIKNWLKTLRKFLVGVHFISQSLADVIDSGIMNVILESCPTRIFLPNPEANTPKIKEQYESIGLNQCEIDLIATATPKQHYYVQQPTGNRLIDLGIGEVSQSFIGLGSERDIEMFTKHFNKNDVNWVPNYLKEKGFKEAAQFVIDQYINTSSEEEESIQ